jgi:hypothetical protein
MWMILSDQKLFFAPVEERMEQGGAEVLDLGTGTGKWAVESAFATASLQLWKFLSRRTYSRRLTLRCSGR